MLFLNAFDVNMLTSILNTSGGHLLDGLQSLGYEIFGALDKTVLETARAIKQGILEKGEVFVVAHSQGTKIFEMALNLLTPEERSKVHYYGAGGQSFVDADVHGLASARNVWNEGDKIPHVNKVSVWSTELSSRNREKVQGGDGSTSWAMINVEKKGNSHNFEIFYSEDMANWANQKIEELGYAKENKVDNNVLGASGTSGLWTGEHRTEQQSNILAYDWKGIQNENGIYSDRG